MRSILSLDLNDGNCLIVEVHYGLTKMTLGVDGCISVLQSLEVSCLNFRVIEADGVDVLIFNYNLLNGEMAQVGFRKVIMIHDKYAAAIHANQLSDVEQDGIEALLDVLGF